MIHAFEDNWPPFWIFLFPVQSHSIHMSPKGKLNPKNVGIAVEIPLISCLEAEIHAFEVKRLPSWIFSRPVQSHSIPMSLNGKFDPENIGIAVEISLISCLKAEIHAFEVSRPPSWIFPLPVCLYSLPIDSSGLLDP